MAACSCCWLLTADAEADGGIDFVEAVPMMTGNSEDTTEAGTPPEVRAPATDEVSSDGLRRLGVGAGDVVATIEDSELRTLETSTVDRTVSRSGTECCGRDFDVPIEVGVPYERELSVLVAGLDEGTMETMVDVVDPDVPG